MQLNRNYKTDYHTNRRNTSFSYNKRTNSNQRFINDSQAPNTMKNYKRHMENLIFDAEEPSMNDETMSMVITLLKHFDEEESRKILSEYGNNESNTDLDNTIVSNSTDPKLNKPRIIDGFPETRGSVLIFVPGKLPILF